jgi:sugar transferase EpsL
MTPGPLATKRLLDVVLAACGLVASAPVLLVIAIAIRLSMGSPVLFRQTRPGLHGQPFELVKFRTMRDPTDAQGNVIETRQRVTRVGSILRRTSLDEIPELYNVLRGEMSVVGPRPLLIEFMQYYNSTQLRRHDMRPGMTGWAQVHGRRTVQMQERIALDVWYVDNWSLRLDARIMLTTVGQILRGQGAEPTRGVPVAELGWTPDEHAGADKEGDGMAQDGLR